jgi:hypothetical protein
MCVSTFDEALKYGATGWNLLAQDTSHVFKYDQQAQANALNMNLELLNQTEVDGIFLWDFMEKGDDPRLSPGIVEYYPSALWSRKLSFYLYQSWRI